MANYRAIALIPLAVTNLSGQTITVSEEMKTRAINAASRVPKLMYQFSGGQCYIDLHIKPIEATLDGATIYSYREAPYDDQYYVSPTKVATATGDINNYDFVLVFSDPTTVNAYTFSGLTTTAGCWALIGDDPTHNDEYIMCHELGHWFTVYFGGLGYSNFPTCGGEPAMHCSTAYGFNNDTEAPWLTAFFSAALPDNTGINTTAWALTTPTQAGTKTRRLPERITTTTWGKIHPPHAKP